MKEFFLFVCVMIPMVIFLILKDLYGNQIYDFFFEDKIIYSCKYEENIYARQTTCNVAANLTKQRHKKLQRDLSIYYDDSEYRDNIEKIKNTVNDILRYRDYSCDPYRMDPINKKEPFYIKNLIYCRELYDDYKAFCGNSYKYCHHLSSNTMPIIYEMYQKLYKYK